MRDKTEPFPPYNPGTCDEPSCCGPVTRRNKRTNEIARFCSKFCDRRYNARALKRGARLYEVAIRWRGAKRSHQRGAKNPPTHFADVTWLLDEFLGEDREMRLTARPFYVYPVIAHRS